MGIVFRAMDPRLRRAVALKVLRPHLAGQRLMRERFIAEARAVAAVRHSHIMPIYEIGEADGKPYFTMALIAGHSLAHELTAGPLRPQRAARLARDAAGAIAYSHEKGVVHRDLKPANILIDGNDHLFVTDFGLAKQTTVDEFARGLTQTGQIMGTPQFMSPEQARGTTGAGPLADVYALGATLYCLLTGRPPFQAASLLETLEQVVERDPAAPRLLNPAVPHDLETICLKCLEKRPERRYPSASALAADLQCFLEHRAIQARPVGHAEKVGAGRRNPVVAVLLAGITALFLTAFVLVSWSYWRAEHAFEEEARQRKAADAALDQAERERKAADAAREQAEREQKAERWERYRSNLVAATSALQLYNVSAARAALEAARPEYRHWEWRHLYNRLDAATHVLGGGKELRQVQFSSHGKWVGTIGRDFKLGLWDVGARKELGLFKDARPSWVLRIAPDGKRVLLAVEAGPIIRDVATGKDSSAMKFSASLTAAMEFSQDGKRLAFVLDNRTIEVWDAVSCRRLHVLHGHTDKPYAVTFSPDSRHLASAGDDKTGRLWDLQTGEQTRVLPHKDLTRELAFSPDGKRLLTCEAFPSNALRLWDLTTGKLIAAMHRHTNEVRTIRFSPDGARIATGGMDQTVNLWDGQTGGHLATLSGHKGWVYTAAFNPNGTRLISASQDQTVRLWDTSDGALLSVLHGHTGDVFRAEFSADGLTIISGSADGSIRVWDARRVEQSGVLRGHTRFVYGVAFHPDGKRAASASWDGTVRLWNIATGGPLAVLRYPRPTIVTSVAIHPAGKLLASLGRDDCVRLWDVDTHKEVHRFPLKSDNWQDSRVTFSPRGDLLAAGGSNARIHLWNVESRAEAATLAGHTGVIRDVVFSPDGAWLASGGEFENGIRIWDIALKKQAHLLQGHTAAVYALAVSRDGRQLASGSMDGTVRLWDTTTWKQLAVLNHGTNVYGVAFTPNGTRLACACANNTIRLWDTAKGQSVAELYGHGLYVHQVAFSPDGRHLLSGSGDFTVRLWHSPAALKMAE